MAICREFVFEFSEYPGLCPVGMESGTPGNGRTVAHDVLEHFSFAGDPVENELQALGALFLLRYESGAQLVNLRAPLHQLLARNVGDVFKDMLNDPSLCPPRRRRVRERDLLPCETVKHAVDTACTELLQTEDLDAEALSRVCAIVEAKAAVCDWLLLGYQRAVARYAGSDAYSVGSHLFNQVAQETEQLLQQDILSPGDRVRVSVDVQGFHVAVRVRKGSRWLRVAQLH